MELILQQANAADLAVDALVLAVDGTGPGYENSHATYFRKIHGPPADALLDAVRYPIPLGQCRTMRGDPPLPKAVFVMATNDHVGQTARRELKQYVRGALNRVFTEAKRLRLTTVALPLPTCGWRLSVHDALWAVVDMADRHPGNNLVVTVCIDAARYEEVTQAARSYGIEQATTAPGVLWEIAGAGALEGWSDEDRALYAATLPKQGFKAHVEAEEKLRMDLAATEKSDG